ncbi:hypothetical protein APU48_01255 [Campylobacter jejuni]|nr:hypothetical protein [Campylobacter jejuni]
MADLEQVASDLNSASQSLQELREKYDGALDLLDNKNTEITAALESAKSNALQEVQTASDTATSQISQLKDTSLNAVNEAKNTATSEISSKKEEALGEFSQATSEFNSTKEEALSQIEQAKTEQGEKITALEQAKTEQESSITELKESVSTQGQKITEIEENNTAQGEKITALEQAKESITADLNKKAKLLTENLTWNVGSGGDYEDLEVALKEASKYIPIGNYTITIKLKSGYILNKKMSFYSQNLGHVIISSEDDIVQSNASSIATSSGSNAIFLFTNSVAPSFNIIIDCFTSSEDKYITGVALYNGTKGIFGVNYGVKNSKGVGIEVSGNSELYSVGLLLENCETGILCNKSILVIPNSKINSCSQYGVRIYDGNICNIINSSFNQTSGTMIQNERGIVYANGVNFNSSSATECNISYNQITSSGIVFK